MNTRKCVSTYVHTTSVCVFTAGPLCLSSHTVNYSKSQVLASKTPKIVDLIFSRPSVNQELTNLWRGMTQCPQCNFGELLRNTVGISCSVEDHQYVVKFFFIYNYINKMLRQILYTALCISACIEK